MGKDIFLPTSGGVVQKASAGIKTPKQWAFGYGAKMHIEDRFQELGGCACNVSVGLKRLSLQTKACGLVGDDADGRWIVDNLTGEGVDTSLIEQLKGGATDSSMILVHNPTGERTIFVNRDVGENLVIKKNVFSNADYVFIGSLYGEQVEQNMGTIHNEITKSQTKLIYNPGMRNIQLQPRTVCDLIHHTSILFVNKTEAKLIVQELATGYNDEALDDEISLLESLAKQASQQAIIVLTAGSQGAWVRSPEERLRILARPQTIVDTTGAGDSFASGFIAGHILNHSLEDCLRWGGANSHNVIGYYGGHNGLLSVKEINEFAPRFEVAQC